MTKHSHSDPLEKAIKRKLKDSKSHNSVTLLFNLFSKKCSDVVGNPISFIVVTLTVIIWAFFGKFFHYSDTWQLVINTTSSVVTFIVVFLIQNTQNRDTKILNLKIDELIKAKKGATNALLNLTELSDKQLEELEKEYKKIKDKETGS